MHLQAAIAVERTNDQVWKFFSDASNLVRWDRSVAQVVLTSSEPFGVGSTFETIAPRRKSRLPREGLRMSYCVTDYVPNHQIQLLLTHSPLFRHAEWSITTEDILEGVQITCHLYCMLRLRYSFLVPILLLTYRGAFRRDLTHLKQAIEQNDVPIVS